MKGSGRTRRWLVRSLPGLLLVATLVDDPLFGSMIVAARLGLGTAGLLAASGVFVVLSVLMAVATAWAMRAEPPRFSPKNQARLASLQRRRLGRYLLPHPGRPVTTAIAAVVFGSVAPIIAAGLEPGPADRGTNRMALVSGVAYGLAFAAGYGLIGALVGTTV